MEVIMDDIKNIYNKDLKSYKDYLKKNKIDYKNLIKYFSEADHLEDQRFDPKIFYLPRKNDFGFVKFNMNNSLGQYIFYVSSYQTTNSQFNSFLNNSNYKCDYQYPIHEHNHPVAWVSWYDAIAYSKWINKIFKSKMITQSAVNQSNNFKELLADSNYQICLLSEKEWVYASTLGKNISYPWGNKVSTKFCNYKTSKIKKTSPVGCYIDGVSESGLFDLSGNTWEWLRTKWGPSLEKRKYKNVIQFEDDRDNINTENNYLRAMKGGSFLVENKRLKIEFEDAVPPESTDDGDGFRIGLVKI
jgi:formylglycine-generating enzyme required for sulfatase activity